jgi:fatty-acyl-CoA synthase
MSEQAGAAAAVDSGSGNRNRSSALLVGAGAALGVLALLVLGAGPLLFRTGLLGIGPATTGVARIAFWFAIAAAGLLAIGLVVAALGRKSRSIIVGIVGLTAMAMLGFRLWAYQQQYMSLPPIHDVQTDWTRPVAFSESALSAREAAHAAPVRDDAAVPEGAGRWAGKSFAAVQSDFYNVKPLLLPGVKPADAIVVAEEEARRLNWNVMRSDPPAGELEATTYSPWYGLGADIAVRVTPQGNGSRIDVRSTSRTPGPDLGANATRVSTLLEDIRFALRAKLPPAEADGTPKDVGSGAPM